MVDIDLTALDALARDAILGHWTTGPGDGVMDGRARHPTGAEVLIYADADCETHPIADFSCNHTCRMDYDTEATAKFVAALVTAWPAIRGQLGIMIDAALAEEG